MDILQDRGWGGRRPSGAGSGSGVVQGLFSGTLTVYIDGTSGNDANSGLASGTALQTLEGFYRKYPVELYGSARILVNLLNASTTTQLTYSTLGGVRLGGGNKAYLPSLAFRGPEMIRITPATGPATAALDATPCTRVDQTQASSGTGNRTSFNFTTASPGWTVNDLAGYFLRVTRAGSLVLYEIPITENTANTIFVDAVGIVGVVLNTDTVEIVQPSVRIEATTEGGQKLLSVHGRTNPECATGVTDYATFERIGFGPQTIFDVEGHVSLDRCHLENGSLAFGFYTGRYGIANVSCQGTVDWQCASGSPIRRAGAGQVNTSVVTGLMIAPKAGQNSSGLRVGSTRSTTHPRGAGNFTHSEPVAVYRATSSNHGILVSGQSQFASFGSVALGGRGSAGVGLKCAHGGRARVQGSTLTTITGTGGDTRLTTGAAVAYGTGAGQLEEAAGFAGTFVRLPVAGTAGDTAMITTQSISSL